MLISAKYLKYLSKPLNPPYISEQDVLQDVESYNCMFVDYPVRKGDEYVEFHKEDERSDRFFTLKLHIDTYLRMIENGEYEIKILEEIQPTNPQVPIFAFKNTVWVFIKHLGMTFEKVLHRF